MSLTYLASQHVPALSPDIVTVTGIAVNNPAQRQPVITGNATQKRDDRYDMLSKYIPIETITIFTAAMSAREALLGPADQRWPIIIYTTCAILTPVVYLLALYGKQRLSGASQNRAFRAAPWPPIAATLAFLAWAWSVPGMDIKGVLEGESARIIGAFSALVVSTLLSLLDPLFDRKPAS